MKHRMLRPVIKGLSTKEEVLADRDRILREMEDEDKKRKRKGEGKGEEAEKEKGNEPKTETRIETLGDYWRIEGVNYRGKIGNYDLSKQFLKGTQDQLIAHTLNARQNNDFGIESIAFHQSLFTTLYNGRNNPQTEEIRKFIDDEMKPRWLLTSTRIRYNPKGKDLVIHNYNMPDKEEIPINFVGGDEWVKDSKTPIIYQSLLGTSDLKQINEVYQWLNKVPAYLWRLNSKPENVVESVAGLDANSNGVILSCDGGAGSASASLGVRRARENLGMI